MNSLRLYTRNVGGLDYRVWTTMLGVCLISVGLFSYQRIKSASMTVQPCKDFQFTINGKTGTVANSNLGSLSIFQLSAESDAKVEWDFGDGTAVQKGPIVQHRFTKEGDYKILATVNEHCEYMAWVTVKVLNAPETEAPAVKIYADSLKAMVGSQLRFSGGANFDVQNYTWAISGTEEIKTGQTIMFSFSAAGKYEVVLMANNDSKITDRKTVEIVPLPIPNSISPYDAGGQNPPVPKDLLGPDGNPFDAIQKTQGNSQKNENTGVTNEKKEEEMKPVILEIEADTFKGLLQEVLMEKKEVEELHKFLYYKDGTIVQVKDESFKLREFCKKKKKKTIEKLEFKKDEFGIQQIKVTLKRSGFLGIKI